MKLFRSFAVAAALVLAIAGTALTSPENPTTDEVLSAYQNAVKVYEWFEHDPLPTQGRERFDSGYMMYYLVSDSQIKTMMDLKQRVRDTFTDSLASFIMSENKMYRQNDKQLFVAPMAKKKNPKRGVPTLTVKKISDDKYIVTAQTPVYTDAAKTTLEKTETVEFPYVRTAKGWRFAYFESLL